MDFAGSDEDERAVARGPGEGGGFGGRAAGGLGELIGEVELVSRGGAAPDGGEAAQGDEGEQQFEGDRQGRNGAGHGDAELFAAGAVREAFDTALDNGGVGEVELLGGGAQEIGFAAAGFDERDVPVGFGDGDGEPWGASATADIDQGLGRYWCVAQEVEDVSPADEGLGGEAGEEGFGVADGGEAEAGVGGGEGLEVTR